MYAIVRLIIVLLLSAWFAAGTMAQEAAAPSTPIAATDSAETDQQIDSRIEAIFDEIDGLQAVFVTVRAGVVTLRGNVTEAPLAERAVELASRVEGVVAVTNEISEVTDVSTRLVPVMERIDRRFWQAVSLVPLATVAILAWLIIFGAGIFIAARKWPWDSITPNAFIAELVRQIIRIIFFVAGIMLALDILGATALLGTILGAAGIVGLAIGFAVRDTVENYIASILLSIRQPFRPKDFVKINEFEGYVIRLTSRATVMMDASGNHVRIPNATVFKSAIINYTLNPQRRFDFTIGVGADSELDRAMKIGTDTIGSLEFVLNDPEPDAWVEDIGDSNITITYVGWVDQTVTGFAKARSEALRLVKLALEAQGITMPEPAFRIINAAETAAEERKKARAAAEQVKRGPVTDTAPDESVMRRIEEEREASTGNDLLNEDAPTELGTQ